MEPQHTCVDSAMEHVIDQYAGMVYRLAYAQLKDKSHADDIFQEVFLRYVQNTPEFESEEHRKAWLLRVTINCCKSFFASTWRRRTVPLEECREESNLPEDSGLREAMDKLPEKYRVVLHLFYYEDLPIAGIAELLHAKPATVRTWLTRAREKLERYMKEEITWNSGAITNE